WKGWAILLRQKQKKLIMLPSETMIWQPEFTDKTLSRKPGAVHECFINWMRDCHSSNDKDVIAIDGKTLRHSYDKSRRRGAIHVISAFSTMHSL
ncbi:hypothetical protein Q2V65_27840, partial [Escherichia coli]|nr:hypothetical protein [Escherichia coli]